MTSLRIRDATVFDGADLVDQATFVARDGTVEWVGDATLDPGDDADETIDAGGRLLTPGLVDCHSFLIHGGDRRDEWADRAGGRIGYADQQTADTGIAATVAATDASSDGDLLERATGRAHASIADGVTTLEVKSGYSFSVEGQLRLLRLAGELRDALPITVRVTLLAGHAYPPDVDRADWVAAICDDLIPAAIDGGLADQVEVCLDEEVGIDLDDASSILETAYRKKIPTRLQTDHLADSAGGALAPAFYARAAAHLNFTDELGIETMAQSGTTAVVLPFAHLELGGQIPPIDEMRRCSLPIAIASGLNPGTAPMASLLGAAHWAVTVFGMTPDEALAGITSAAARALDLDDGTGRLRAGGRADLALWDVTHPHELVYSGSGARLVGSWVAGERVAPAPRDTG